VFSQKGEKLHTGSVHRHVSKQQTKRMTSIHMIDPDPDPEMEFLNGIFSLSLPDYS
jgi:hypothetical protein